MRIGTGFLRHEKVFRIVAVNEKIEPVGSRIEIGRVESFVDLLTVKLSITINMVSIVGHVMVKNVSVKVVA